jgi:hypothetical protein
MAPDSKWCVICISSFCFVAVFLRHEATHLDPRWFLLPDAAGCAGLLFGCLVA